MPFSHSCYLSIDGTAIERAAVMRNLGVLFDEKRTFGVYIDNIVSAANRALGLIFRSLATDKRGRLILLDTCRNANI